MKNEMISIIKKMADGPVGNPGKTAMFLSKREWLRARELGWFNFTDEQLVMAPNRNGLIAETQDCLLYVQVPFYTNKERRFTSHNKPHAGSFGRGK